jgi:hypothetical protein
VHIRRTHADLLVRGEVAAGADPGADEDHWQLTRTRIQRAVKAGWTAASLSENLSQRAQQPVPALLIVAIRAWAGERALPKAVAVASDMLLQIADPTVAHAIATSTLLQPYLRGQLGPLYDPIPPLAGHTAGLWEAGPSTPVDISRAGSHPTDAQRDCPDAFEISVETIFLH